MDRRWIRLGLMALVGVLGCGGDDATAGESGAATGGAGETGTTGDAGGSTAADAGSSEGADETADETSSGTTQGEPRPPNTDCAGATPIDQAGDSAASGVEQCDDGLLHRGEAVACAVPTPPESTCSRFDACQAHADCTQRAGGLCLDTESIKFGCECVYPECSTDADCEGESLCLCAGAEDGSPLPLVPQCISATCQTDADCGDGLCGIQRTSGECGNVSHRAACLTEDSECRDASNCGELVCDFGEGGTYNEICRVSDGAWACIDPGCGPSGCG